MTLTNASVAEGCNALSPGQIGVVLKHAMAEAVGLQQCSAGLALPRCLQRSRRPNRRAAEGVPCDGITTNVLPTLLNICTQTWDV
jgi:hypothetical protein